MIVTNQSIVTKNNNTKCFKYQLYPTDTDIEKYFKLLLISTSAFSILRTFQNLILVMILNRDIKPMIMIGNGIIHIYGKFYNIHFVNIFRY